MNVEPGILVMYHSIKNVPLVSSTLLDFLCRIMKQFYPKGEERIRGGVHNSLRIILEKQVIPNLATLFESPKLDKDLKAALCLNFREFMPVVELNHEVKSDEAQFSDEDEEKTLKIECPSDEDEDDDDLPLSKVRLKEKPTPDKVDLPTAIRDSFEKFLTTKTPADLDALLGDLRTATLDADQESYVFDNVSTFCKSTLPEKSELEEFKSLAKLEQSVNFPLFAIFKVLVQLEEKGGKRCPTLGKLLEYCHSRAPNMGFQLLYYLKVHAKLVSKKNEKSPVAFKAGVYKLFYQWINPKAKDPKIEACLETDLELMEQWSLAMFLWLVPDLYREFVSIMVNSDVLRIVVGCVDAKNLGELIFDITQGKLVMFKSEGVIDVVRESLEFETFEQIFVWQLLHAHDVPISSVQEILPELEQGNNEALTSMLFMLKNEEPSEELVKLLLSRDVGKGEQGDQFVTSALR